MVGLAEVTALPFTVAPISLDPGPAAVNVVLKVPSPVLLVAPTDPDAVPLA